MRDLVYSETNELLQVVSFYGLGIRGLISGESSSNILECSAMRAINPVEEYTERK